MSTMKQEGGCHLKMQIVLSSLILLSTMTAQAGSDDFFRELETDRIKILSPETCEAEFQKEQSRERRRDLDLVARAMAANGYPHLLNKLGSIDDASSPMVIQPEDVQPTDIWKWFDWIPDGLPYRANKPQCSSQALEELILSTSTATALQSEVIGQFFTRCGRHMARRAGPSWLVLVKSVTMQYDVCQHSRIRKVVIHLPDGNKIRGLLAMKPGRAKRPLIITKCGVFCNAGAAGHRLQIMHLFDEGPFNVLALGNITGTDYVLDNEHLALGGFDAGMQLIRLIQLLHDSPIDKYISSVHFAGVSLGSHAGLFASYINEYHDNKYQERHLRSVLAFCPVVDLETSVNSLFEKNLKGRIAAYVFFQQLIKVIKSIPILRDLFPDLRHGPPVEGIPALVADGALDYYRKVPDGWAIEPFRDVRLQTREDLWTYNQFLSFGPQVKGTPTLLWAGDDDWVISTDSNSKKLSKELLKVTSSPVSVFTTRRGNHCALGMAYGWDISSSLHRAYFLSHSPELLANRHLETVSLNPMLFKRVTLRPAEKHFSQSWHTEASKDFITVEFKIHSPLGSHDDDSIFCMVGDPYTSDESCYRTERIRIPYSAIRASWARNPKNKTEAEALTRWANINLKLVDDQGQKLHLRKTQPAGVTWISYEPEPAIH